MLAHIVKLFERINLELALLKIVPLLVLFYNRSSITKANKPFITFMLVSLMSKLPNIQDIRPLLILLLLQTIVIN